MPTCVSYMYTLYYFKKIYTLNRPPVPYRIPSTCKALKNIWLFFCPRGVVYVPASVSIKRAVRVNIRVYYKRLLL